MSWGNCSFARSRSISSTSPTPGVYARSLPVTPKLTSENRGCKPRKRVIVWDVNILQFTESRRLVSVVKLPTQHLEKKGESRRTGIYAANSSRDLLYGCGCTSLTSGGGGARPPKRSRELLTEQITVRRLSPFFSKC